MGQSQKRRARDGDRAEGDGAGHGFMCAGEAPDANAANKKARDDAFKRWLELMKKI